MFGSGMEWLDDWYREGEQYRRAAGGSSAQTDPNSAFLIEGGLGVRPANAWNMVGFRLVARSRYEPADSIRVEGASRRRAFGPVPTG
jgi:hypothetical protein